MRVLLDTPVWRWMLAAPERLSKRSRALVTAAEHKLLPPAASAWEIAIKHALGKLPVPEPPVEYISRFMTSTGITPRPVYHRHALHVATLPAHHADPFDRLLIAQAQIEHLPVLTADRVFRKYDVQTIAA